MLDAFAATPVSLSQLHFTGGDATALGISYGGTITRSAGSSSSRALNIDHCLFDHNQAERRRFGWFGGTLSINDTTAADSNAAIDKGNQSLGGAIYMNNYSGLSLTRTSFTNNSSDDSGGAIYVETGNNDTTATILDSLFANNTAKAKATTTGGGAIFASLVAFDIHNTTFFNNQVTAGSGGAGGALFLDGGGFDFPITLNNVTISGNSAPVGGGIALLGSTGATTVTLSNTILSANLGSNCNLGTNSSLVSAGYNLLGTGCALAPTTGDFLSDTPGLASALGATTPTQTLALLPGSPAIDKGNPGTPNGTPPRCEVADQINTAPTGRRRLRSWGVRIFARCGCWHRQKKQRHSRRWSKRHLHTAREQRGARYGDRGADQRSVARVFEQLRRDWRLHDREQQVELRARHAHRRQLDRCQHDLHCDRCWCALQHGNRESRRARSQSRQRHFDRHDNRRRRARVFGDHGDHDPTL